MKVKNLIFWRYSKKEKKVKVKKEEKEKEKVEKKIIIKEDDKKKQKRLKKRFYLIRELVETEKSYLDKLKRLVSEILEPLSDKKGKYGNILTQQQIKTMFSEVKSIIFLN